MRMGIVGIAVTLMAVAAWGQERPLSGPPVKEDRPAGLGGQFGEGRMDRRGPMMERTPIRVYQQAIAKLRGEEAPADLRLTEEQDKQIKEIEQEFRAAARRAAERARRDGGQRRRPAEGEDAMNPAQMEEARRAAPRPEDAAVKIYAVLNDKQKAFVEADVQKQREEIERKRSEEYIKREMAKNDGQPKPDVRPAVRPAPAAEPRERFRRLMERIQQLPPEEREQLLQRLEQEIERRTAEPRRQREGERKPAPSMKDVDVPPPNPR